jgi:D-xylose reductase
MHSRNTFERPRRILAAIGGPSLDDFATGSGIRQAESKVGEDIPAPTSAVGSGVLMVPTTTKKFNPATTNARASKVPMKVLARTGDSMPVLGLGMWKVPKDVTAQCVIDAIEAGWRHFDCACDYGNEKEVGDGIRQAISSGSVTREELWVTSKLWNTYHNPEHVLQACNKSLEDLGLDYLDLYLIHFPISLKFVPFEERYPPEWIHAPNEPNPRMEFANEPLHKTWAAMEALVDNEKVRNIGMCNIGMCMLSDMLSYAKYAPQVLQVEIHPYNTQEYLSRYCNEKDVFVTGFSPLGAGSYVELNMATSNQSALLEKVVTDLGTKYNCSPAQVILKWGVQCGRSVIPKTTKKERLIENIELFSFDLTEDECKSISDLNKNMRFNDPGEFCQGMGAFCPIYN